jgi:peptide-methionine (S)-S-oxide reductase
VISYREILEVFFATHDPTTLNRQGADIGTQYRSAVYAHSDEQRATAQSLIDELGRDEVFDDPIVTQVERLGEFYPAERYHDEYYRRNASQPYCQAVISPKLAKFRQRFAHRLKTRT